jgi:DNA-binding NarL/FixJ family response regulator
MNRSNAAAPEAQKPGSHGDRTSLGYEFTNEDVVLLQLIATNTPRDEIAATLRCSGSTISRHLASLRDELHVDTTIEVIVAAVRAGVI